MQSSTEHDAAPEAHPESGKKAPKSSNNDGGKGSNNNTGSKRMKTSRACDECRKRKVKCDGLQPCERCRKAEIDCIFAKQPPKRGPPKQYIEHLEARIQLVEKAIRNIDGPARQILAEASSMDLGKDTDSDAMVTSTEDHDAPPSPALSTQSISEADRFTLDIYGQGQYINDIKAQNLREEPPLSQMMSMDTASQTDSCSPYPGLPNDVPFFLIEAYFTHVHKYLPMVYKIQFLQQAVSKHDPPSPILVYAMCAVASRWVTDNVGDGNNSTSQPGINYYNRAFTLIEEYSDAPRVATIQALILLAKYQETYVRPGYRFRPGMFISIAVGMCNDLGLAQLGTSKNTDSPKHETELKKRTFWVTFIYDLIYSMEQRREPSFTTSSCTTGFPMPIPEESPELEELILNHNSLIQLSKILSDIYFMSRRTTALQQNRTVDRWTTEYIVEQNGRVLLLNTHLENFIHELPGPLAHSSGPDAQLTYPMEKLPVTDIFIAHLHMTYNMAVILLHSPYIVNPLPPLNGSSHDAYHHRALCAASASHITNIAESILEHSSSTLFSYTACGTQHAIYCLGIAASIHRQEMSLSQNPAAKTQHDKTQEILRRLKEDASTAEHHVYSKDVELSQMYRQMTVDPNKSLSMQQPLFSSAQSTTSVASSPSTEITTASMSLNDRVSVSDASSTSSSPVQTSMDTPRPRGAKQKHRGSTLTVSNNPGLVQMAKNVPRQMDMQQLQPSKIHPSAIPFPMEGGSYNPAIYNSSGSYADPARYTSIMMQAGANVPAYNFLQHPAYGNMRSSIRRQSPYPMYKAHSQEDLRGNYKAQFNKNTGNHWPGQRASFNPADLYSKQSFANIGVDYNANTHHSPALAATSSRTHAMRRPASMASMKTAYNAHRMQPPVMQTQHHIHVSPAANAHRRNVMTDLAMSDELQQAVTTHDQSTMHNYYAYNNGSSASLTNVDMLNATYALPLTTHSQDTKMSHTAHQPPAYSQHLLGQNSQSQCLYTAQQMDMDVPKPASCSMVLDPPPIPTEDVTMNQLFLANDPNMAISYMMQNSTVTGSMEDLQRSEGHVV